jgi:hypothetical protein
MVKQGNIEGFFCNTDNAERLSGLVEDIRDAMVDYQVCINDTSIAPLTFASDFVATRRLQQELRAYCEPHLLSLHPLGTEQ